MAMVFLRKMRDFRFLQRVDAESEYNAAISNGDETLADQKKTEMDYFQRRMDEDAFMVTLHLMYDTIGFDQDSLLVWMENLDNFGMDLTLSLYHQNKGNSILANAYYQKAEQRNDLTTQQSADLTNMLTLLDMLEGKSPYSLSDGELATLENLAQSDESYTGNIARNILTWYGYHFPPTYRLPEGSGNRQGYEAEKSIISDESLYIFPNPGQDVFIILWESHTDGEKEATLYISDITGKRLNAYSIANGASTEIHLDNEHKGILLYQLVSNDRIIQSGKLIV